jgi:hypothetical protein
VRLSKIDGVWTLRTEHNLKRWPIKFLQPTDGSSSELTDFDLSLDEDEDPEMSTPNTNLNSHPAFAAETTTKRSRETSEDDESKNRSGKRAKLEEIVHSISSLPCTPIPSSDGQHPGDDDPLPKFKVPRHILHSYGWIPLSTMDRIPRRRQRKEQGEEPEPGTNAACSSISNASTSVPASPNPISSTTVVPYPPTPSDSMNDSNVNPSVGPNKDGYDVALRVSSQPLRSEPLLT